MKKVTSLLLFIVSVIVASAQPVLVWQNRFDYDGGIDYPLYSKIDSEGNVYITGTSNVDTFNNDIITIKINADGITEWYNLIRNNYDDVTSGLVVDNDANSFIGGRLGDIFLEKGGFVARYNGDGSQAWMDSLAYSVKALYMDTTHHIYALCSGQNIRIIKYNALGEKVLDFTNDTIVSSSSPQMDLFTVDDHGNIYAAGQYYSRSSNYKFVIKKFSEDGELLWDVKYNPTAEIEYPWFMEVDNEGNIYMAGYIGGFHEGALLAKFNSEGELLWDDILFDISGFTYSLLLDADENPVLCAKVYELHTEREYLVSKYDHEGNTLWKDYQDSVGAPYDKIAHLAADASGNIYFVGTIWPTISSMPCFFMIKYNADGNKLWEYRADSLVNTSNDYPVSLTLDAENNIFVTMQSYVADTKYDFLTLKFSDVTGVEEITSANEVLSISPNPFHSTACVNISTNTLIHEDGVIMMIDMFGRVVKKDTFNSQYKLDRNGVPNGVYFVKVVFPDGISINSKIVID